MDNDTGNACELRLDHQPTLHLEVQGRAELGAVEGEGTGTVAEQFDADHFTWVEAGLHVVRRDGEAVGGVGGGLDVGDVQAQGVADVELDLVGRLSGYA